MSAGIQNNYRSPFERTPTQRAEFFVRKVLTIIDDPLACKGVDGRSENQGIAYIEADRDPEDFVRTKMLETLRALCGFPESECYIPDEEPVPPNKPYAARLILHSLAGGNALFETRHVDEAKDGKVWGHTYWVKHVAPVET